MTELPIRVLIADDQVKVRAAFRFFLDSQPDMTVVAEARDGIEAVRLAGQLAPDVCLLDIRMPRLDGLEATRLLVDADVLKPPRVVVVTTFDDDQYVYAALRNGACGFLLKDSGPTLLAEAIRAAFVGDSLISPSITVRLLKQLTRTKTATRDKAGGLMRQPREPLTERELDITKLVALGHTNAEIAERLYVSLSTVKTHLGNIQIKLDARNRVEIAAWAWQSGIPHGR